MACSGVAKLNITYTNNTPTTPRVTFTNTLDDLNYYDNNFSASTSGTAGNIPAGTYNITIAPSGFTGVYTFTYQVGAASPVTVTGKTVLNLAINATVNIVITGRIYYNAAISSSPIAKSNCPSGYSAVVIYPIHEGKYTSTVSQTAANTLAQNDITANGQAYADANGVCMLPVPCAITPAVNWNMVTSSMSATATTVTFYLIENTNANISWYSSTLVGTITGACKPSANRVMTYTENSRVWEVTVTIAGDIYSRLISGPVPTSLPFTMAIYPALTYNL
jgi:hypothetical protein